MSDLASERLAELRRLAEAATPGPWEVVGLDGYGGPYALRMPHRSGRTWYGVGGIKRREDAEYFVAMNRNTVLALLDEIERLREDAARYRWLRKGESDDIAVVRGLGAMGYGMSAVIGTHSEEIDGDDLDAAIDAAMGKGNGND